MLGREGYRGRTECYTWVGMSINWQCKVCKTCVMLQKGKTVNEEILPSLGSNPRGGVSQQYFRGKFNSSSNSNSNLMQEHFASSCF